MRDGLGERIACEDGDDTATADDIDALGDCEHPRSSGELVRDLDKDGITKPQDCNDADPAIRPGVRRSPDDGSDQDCDGADATNPDRDGDGVRARSTATTRTRRSRPARRSASATRSTRTATAAPIRSRRSRAGARALHRRAGRGAITRLQVVRPRRGTTVQVRCKGAGCGFKRRSR